MTCIVALKHKGRVTMGGDSAGVSRLDVTIRVDPKVFKNGKFLIGYTSSFRMGQILRYKFTPPPIPRRGDLFRYMCVDFVDAARRAMKRGGYSEIDSNVERGGTFLVGAQGRIFSIQSDFQVGESAEPFEAIGCGEPFALGTLNAQPITMTPKARIQQALETASKFSGGVRPPFVILSV